MNTAQYLEALHAERERLQRHGLHDRVQLVDAEIARITGEPLPETTALEPPRTATRTPKKRRPA